MPLDPTKFTNPGIRAQFADQIQVAERQQAEQQQEAERLQREQAQQQEAQAKQAQAVRNTELETRFRAEGRPAFKNDFGDIQPHQPDEVWTAEQQKKATLEAAETASRQQEDQYKKEGRKYAPSSIKGAPPIPLQSDADLEAQRVQRAEKLRSDALLKEMKTLQAEAQLAPQSLSLTERKQKETAAKKLRDQAKFALASTLSTAASQTDKAGWYDVVNNNPTPEAQAAKARIARLSQPDADLDDEDLALLESNEQHKPLAAQLKVLRGTLSADDEAKALREKTRLRLADLNLRRLNPQKWQEKERARRAALDPESLAADLETASADLQSRDAALAEAYAPIAQRRLKRDQDLAALEAQNAQRAATGIPAGELVTFQGPDGTPQPWARDLAQQREALIVQHDAFEAESADAIETLRIQQQELQQVRALRNEAATAHTQKQEKARTDRFADIRAMPGMAPFADSLANLQQEEDARTADIAEMYPDESPERQAAMDTIARDVQAKRETAIAGMEEREQRGRAFFADLADKERMIMPSTGFKEAAQDITASVAAAKKKQNPNANLLESTLVWFGSIAPGILGAAGKAVGGEADYPERIEAALQSDPAIAKRFEEIAADHGLSKEEALGWFARLRNEDEAKQSVVSELLGKQNFWAKVSGAQGEGQDPRFSLEYRTALAEAKKSGDAQRIKSLETPIAENIAALDARVESTLQKVQKDRGFTLSPEDAVRIKTQARFEALSKIPVGLKEMILKPGAGGVGYAGSKLPFVGGFVDAARLWPLAQTAEKLQKGEEVSQTELAELQEAVAYMQRDRTFWAGAVDIVATMPAFMVELATTAGTAAASKNAALGALKALLGARVASSLTARTAAGLFGEAVRAPLASGSRILAEGVQRFGTQGVNVQETPEGKLVGSLDSTHPTWWQAMGRGYAQNLIANSSERFGNFWSASKIGQQVNGELGKAAFIRALQKLNPAKGEGAVADFLRKAGRHGTLMEMVEERVNELGEGLVFGEWRLPSGEQLAQELISFAATGGAAIAASSFSKKPSADGSPAPTAPANPANSPERIAAAEAAIDNYAPETLSPEQIETTRNTARTLLYIGQGQIDELPDADLALVGIQRNAKGELENSKSPDGSPPRVKVENGNPIITQPTLDKLATEMPDVLRAIPGSEAETRARYKAVNTSPPAPTSPQPGTSPNAPQSAAPPPGDQSPARGPSGQGPAAPAPGGAGSAQGASAASPAAGAPAGPSAAPADQSFATGSPEATRASHLTNHLAERGLPADQAAQVAAHIVATQGIVGNEYTEQVIGPKFRETLTALGITGSLNSKDTATNPLRAGTDLNRLLAERGRALANVPPVASAASDNTAAFKDQGGRFSALRARIREGQVADLDAAREVVEALGSKEKPTEAHLAAALEHHLGVKPARAKLMAAIYLESLDNVIAAGARTPAMEPSGARQTAAGSPEGTRGGADQSPDNGPINTADRSTTTPPNAAVGVKPLGDQAAPVAVTAPASTKPARNPDYQRARAAALAKIPAGPKREKALAILDALEKALAKRGAAFDAMLVGKSAITLMGGAAKAASASVGEFQGQITLLLHLDKFIAQHAPIADPTAAVASTVNEEVIHAIAYRLSREDARFTQPALVQKWQELPPEIRNTVWNAYHAAGISRGAIAKDAPADLSKREQFHLMHEFLRMVVQDKAFRGQITETVDANPTLKDWLLTLLRDLSDALRKFIGQAPAPLRADIEAYASDITAALQEIEKLSPSAPALPTNAGAANTARRLAARDAPLAQPLRTILTHLALTDGGFSDSALARLWDRLPQTLQSRFYRDHWRPQIGPSAPKAALMREFLAAIAGDPRAAQAFMEDIGTVPPAGILPWLRSLLQKLLSHLRSWVRGDVPSALLTLNPGIARDLGKIIGRATAARAQVEGAIHAYNTFHTLAPRIAQALPPRPRDREEGQREREMSPAALSAAAILDAEVQAQRNASPAAAAWLRAKLLAEEKASQEAMANASPASGPVYGPQTQAQASAEAMVTAWLENAHLAMQNSSPEARHALRQRLLAQARAAAWLHGESRAEIQATLDRHKATSGREGLSPGYIQMVGRLLRLARGEYTLGTVWNRRDIGSAEAPVRMSGSGHESALNLLGIQIAPDGTLTAAEDAPVYVERNQILIKQETLDTLEARLPITRQLIGMTEAEAREMYNLPRRKGQAAASETSEKSDPSDSTPPPALSDRITNLEQPSPTVDAPAAPTSPQKALPDPTGADIITWMRREGWSLGSPPADSTGTGGEWDWLQDLEKQAAESPEHWKTVEAAAARGDVTHPRARLAWLKDAGVLTEGTPSRIDEVAEAAREAGFDVDASSIGASVLAAIDARVTARETPDADRFTDTQELQSLRFERDTQDGPLTIEAGSLVDELRADPDNPPHLIVKDKDGQPHKVKVVAAEWLPMERGEMADYRPNHPFFRRTPAGPERLFVRLQDGTTYGSQFIPADTKLAVDGTGSESGPLSPLSGNARPSAPLPDVGTEGTEEDNRRLPAGAGGAAGSIKPLGDQSASDGSALDQSALDNRQRQEALEDTIPPDIDLAAEADEWLDSLQDPVSAASRLIEERGALNQKQALIVYRKLTALRDRLAAETPPKNLTAQQSEFLERAERTLGQAFFDFAPERPGPDEQLPLFAADRLTNSRAERDSQPLAVARQGEGAGGAPEATTVNAAERLRIAPSFVKPLDSLPIEATLARYGINTAGSFRNPRVALALLRGQDPGTDTPGSGSSSQGDGSQDRSASDGTGLRRGAAALPRLEPEAFVDGLAAITDPEDVHQGEEHLVYRDARTHSAVKLTNPGETGKGTSLEGYLERLIRMNDRFADHTLIEGWVQLPGEDAPRLVTTQPWIYGRKSTLPEIATYMRRRGFLRVFDGAWWDPKEEIEVTDALEKNFRTDPEGRVHPIDLLFQKPRPSLQERIEDMVNSQEQPEPEPEPPLAAADRSPLSRLRGGNIVEFKTPIRTPLGLVTSYVWQSKLEEGVDQRGEDVLRRVSDWDKAATNAETGRDIVHHFTVKDPDGNERTVSLESTMKSLAGTDAAKVVKAAVAAARRLAVREQELETLTTAKETYETELQGVKRQPIPAPELRDPEYPGLKERGIKAVYIGGVWVDNVNPDNTSEWPYPPGRLSDRAWHWQEAQVKFPKPNLNRLADLQILIRRDRKKVKEAQSLAAPAAIGAAESSPADVGVKASADQSSPDAPKSSTQLTLSPDAARPVLNFGKMIPESQLYHDVDPEWGSPREDEPHITVLYGLTNHEAGPVAETIAGHGPITVTLGKLSLFENDEYDVLKVDVESPSLRALNQKLRKLPHHSTFPDYQPHMTIAYLKKGEGKKYIGKTPFAGRTLTFDTVTFSPPEKLRPTLGTPELPLAESGPRSPRAGIPGGHVAPPDTDSPPLAAGDRLSKVTDAVFRRIPAAVTGAVLNTAGAVTDNAGGRLAASFGSNNLDQKVAAALARVAGPAVKNAKQAAEAWLHKPGGLSSFAKNVVIDQALPMALVPREWLALYHEMQRKTAVGAEHANDVIRALSGNPRFSDLAYPPEFAQDPRHREMLFDAMENRIPMASLPPAMQAVAAKLRALLATTGRELVKQGIMNTDTFEELSQAGWMPRYMHDEAEAAAGGWIQSFRLGVKDLLQQRSTAFHIVDTTRKDPATGEYATVNREEGGKRNRWRFRDAQSRDGFYSDFIRREALRFLQEGGKEVTALMASLDSQQRREVRAEMKGLTRDLIDLPAKLSPALAGMVRHAIEIQKSRYAKKDPFVPPKLIKDPVYAVARYVLAQTHNAATMELLRATSQQPAWTSEVDVTGFTKIPDNARFGPLAKLYVKDDIAEQIMDMVGAPNAALAFYDNLLRKWKAGKLVWNPGSHIRDAVGNTVFAYIGGNSLWNPGNWPYYRDAFAALRSGGPAYRELIEQQVLGGDAYSNLVRERLRGLLPDSKTVEDYNPGLVLSVLMGFGSKLHGAHDFLSELRRFPDDFYKTAAFLKYKAQGLTPQEAAAKVRKWFPYYDRLGSSATIRAVGRFANPFVSFFRESTRILATAAAERPIALTTAIAFPSIITAISAMMLGLDDDDTEQLKKDMSGKGKWFGTDTPLFSMLLPIRSAYGKVQQWNISAVMPFGDLLATKVEIADRDEDPWQRFWRGISAGGPFLTLLQSWSNNKDAFSGRPIAEHGMTAGERIAAYGKHAANTLLPPLAPGGSAFKNLAAAGERTAGGAYEVRDPGQAFTRSIIGLDVRNATPDLHRMADDWRAKNGFEAPDGVDLGDTTPASRARKALYRELTQDQPNLRAIKNLATHLEKLGSPVRTPQEIQRVLFYRNPLMVIGGDKRRDLSPQDAQAMFRASLTGEERATLETALAEYQRIKARAPMLIQQAQFSR